MQLCSFVQLRHVIAQSLDMTLLELFHDFCRRDHGRFKCLQCLIVHFHMFLHVFRRSPELLVVFRTRGAGRFYPRPRLFALRQVRRRMLHLRTGLASRQKLLFMTLVALATVFF